jgi:hypothetical protein
LVRRLVAVSILLAALALASCGGGDHSSSDSQKQAKPGGGYLAAGDLERQLGNAFRKGLYRLAVMSQKSEDAKDLGQPLPTGLVDGVKCTSSGAQPSGRGVWMWSCAVKWKSVEHRVEQTKYVVRLTPGLCFAAGATPARAKHYDSTIRTYSEDPLNALGSVRPGC